MLERINGFTKTGVTGYFYGKNTLVSVAIDDVVAVKATGAVSSLAGVQRFLNSTEAATVVKYLNDKGIVRVDGSAFVVGTLAADYQASYSAQTNLKRVIDIIQQRAVILATSDVATAVNVTAFSTVTAGAVASAAITGASVITFLVERADVFNKDAKSLQGVPTGTVEVARNLIEDLSGVSMIDATGAVVLLASGASANYAVKLYANIPALSL